MSDMPEPSSDTIGGSVPQPPSLPSALRWGRWAIFGLAVAAAAVVARNAADARHPEADGIAHESAPRHPAAPLSGAWSAASTPDATREDRAGAEPSGDAVADLARSYALEPGGKLIVGLAAGDVQVRPGAGPDVRVIVALEPDTPATSVRIVEQEVRPGLVRLSVEAAGKDGGSRTFLGGRIRIGSSLPINLGIRHVSVELPAGVHSAISTGAGDVDIQDVSGDVAAETGAGDIECRRCLGAFDASTGAGDVSLTDVSGTAHVESGAGDVRITRAGGSVSVETGAGSIKVTDAASSVDLESGVGSIEVQAASMSAPISVETGMGSIEVHVASGGFDLDAESGMGSVAITTSGQTERSSGLGGELRRAVGGGGPRLRLESGAGSIEVHAPTSGSSRTAT